MIIGNIADRIVRGVETVQEGVNEALFEPVIRVGITGLSRAGKTVFITSLVANLLDRGRMPQLGASSAITAAYLQPQPDDTVPRFDYETHLAALTAPVPHWPDSTRAVSELRLSFKVQPTGILGMVSGPRTIHLDILDYPGEWLLDLGLMEKSYSEWSESTISAAKSRDQSAEFLTHLDAIDAHAKHDEQQAKSLAQSFTTYLKAAREAGYSDCSPGRFLLPGEMEGSPVLTFAPLPSSEAKRGTLAREFERRYEAYKREVVKPFFRDHFAKIDRQVVLVDALGAIHAGPKAVEDLRRTLSDILGAFRPGRVGRLLALLGQRRVDRVLFAASKADHIHHSQHPRLTAIMEALVRDARDRADFAGATTSAMSIAALRATVEETIDHNGETLDCVRGRTSDGKQAAFYPGELPQDPSHILTPARKGAEKWLDGDYEIMRFEPARLTLKPVEGPPHIRLDRAAEFLIGDKL
ncbi:MULTISPECIES: YcjX family protein [Pacificibacter]|uniref:YcjX family protein n=1 Tax=Pacificibacter TaxID=1042323 RepID=UPI001C09CBDA|nr:MULTISPECIES: YcjX family protein [Pacificibacter]MBU2934841.1 YcjX family protein [Pacificibacter marinus]MDO6615815.1 YcjX family protein [Pacificibacter sp. 1_MG-2023]